VGFWIAYNENTTQGHKLGLYGISVPEPETYLILGMALLSIAIVFRKRISESLAEARALMRS
jgi:hydrogenase/urease accessory protein HupE